MKTSVRLRAASEPHAFLYPDFFYFSELSVCILIMVLLPRFYGIIYSNASQVPLWVWVALCLFGTAVTAIVESERWQFSTKGVTISTFCIHKAYFWSEFVFCGMLPCEVRFEDGPNYDWRICFSKEVPEPGKDAPEECYWMEYSDELYEIFRLLAPNQFPELPAFVAERASAAQYEVAPPTQRTPEEILREMRLLDLCLATVLLPAIVSALFAKSVLIRSLMLVISVTIFCDLREGYFGPLLGSLFREYQAAYLQRLRTELVHTAE